MSNTLENRKTVSNTINTMAKECNAISAVDSCNNPILKENSLQNTISVKPAGDQKQPKARRCPAKNNLKSSSIKLKPKLRKNLRIAKTQLTDESKSLKSSKNTHNNKALQQNSSKKKLSKLPNGRPDDDSDTPPVLEPMCPIGEINACAKRSSNIKKSSNTQSEVIAKGRKSDTKPDVADTDIASVEQLIKTNLEAAKSAIAAPGKKQIATKKVQKDNLENGLTYGPAACKVIDMLDLNVTEPCKKIKIVDAPTIKRRHSIEKVNLSGTEYERINPRGKFLLSRMRHMLGNVNALPNPYNMRSRMNGMLRNGKSRKLKSHSFNDTLERPAAKRRKRNTCSEYSSSDVSNCKLLSGYESDSTYSDNSTATKCNDTTTKEIDNGAKSTDAIKTEVDVKVEAIDEFAMVENTENKPTNPAMPNEPWPVENVEQIPVLDRFPDLNIPIKVDQNEDLSVKEDMLQALGLQSLRAAEEAKKRRDVEQATIGNETIYTGTLKTIIRLNREKRRRHVTHRVALQKSSRVVAVGSMVDNGGVDIKTGDGQHTFKGDDGSSEPNSEGEAQLNGEVATKLLVIPEKASSFSIHPGRLCNDQCTYCLGKFGLYDTPCHIAQIKSIERQNKILNAETQLLIDSCVCDACFRLVVRKANAPSFANKSLKRSALVAPGPKPNHCHVLGCGQPASNILRRKWIIKMRKSVCDVMNIDLDNIGLHSIPICDTHYAALEHLMVCAMCKRRLARNHVHYFCSDILAELNASLAAEKIPLTLNDKPVVCKLCKCFTNIVLKDPSERPANTHAFFEEYKKRLLHFNDIVPMDEAAAEEPIVIPSHDEPPPPLPATQCSAPQKSPPCNSEQTPSNASIESSIIDVIHNAVTKESSPPAPPQIQLIPKPLLMQRLNSKPSNTSISDSTHSGEHATKDSSKELGTEGEPTSPANNLNNGPVASTPLDCTVNDQENNKGKVPPPVVELFIKAKQKVDNVKQQLVDLAKTFQTNNGTSNGDFHAVQRLGANPSISVRQLFPHEEELQLQGNIEFNNARERTPEGWDKCVSVIQYDSETKQLWQDLQKPYGNQSSFLRHLILLEKYFRNGDLVLAPNASHHASIYSESVQNRLRSFDNYTPRTKTNPKASTNPSCTVVTTASNIRLVQGARSTLRPLALHPLVRGKSQPPDLISIQTGSKAPTLPTPARPQSKKIKFPMMNNWRPKLIPIDPQKKPDDRREIGLVQVISRGKPYHITLDDYKKMYAIKKTFEMKEKKIAEAQHNGKSTKHVKVTVATATATCTTTTTPAAVNTLPKMPKSLTVIPQSTITASNASQQPAKVPKIRPTSPILLITPKPKSHLPLTNNNNNNNNNTL